MTDSLVRLTFAPLLDDVWLWCLAVLGGALLIYTLWSRPRGGVLRLLAFALLGGAILNPIMLSETRQPLADTVAVVVDQSFSQTLKDRSEVSAELRDKVLDRLKDLPNFETRLIETDTSEAVQNVSEYADGTYLITAAADAISDLRADHIGGIVFITDGQVHDTDTIPAAFADIPVHVLLTGSPQESDRRVFFTQQPKFGVVGEEVTVTVQVEDTIQNQVRGSNQPPVPLTVTFGGDTTQSYSVQPGQPFEISVPIEHGGANLLQVSVPVIPGELTAQNNMAHAVVQGVRDRLKVLLISGEPHAGERVWRNLLKSDPSVELVHFTILRPPTKRDNASVRELSLIAFPTRQLFRDRLNEFDLVIFDRYARKGVLSANYFLNMAEYVENGGSILVAAGPSFASPLSLHRSPLAAVLPSEPTGEVLEQGFRPQVTDMGWRHPITSNLAVQYYDQTDMPVWGRWYRTIQADATDGDVLMTDEDQNPLMIVNRVGEGRVAQVLSDHMWLWSRGLEGGGPQTELLRRLAHWLMKEPELDEESLSISDQNGQLAITVRSLQQEQMDVTVIAPDGTEQTLKTSDYRNGVARLSLPATYPGLYTVNVGGMSAIAVVGAVNPKELEDMRTTDQNMRPITTQTGGGVFWSADGQIPTIRSMGIRTFAGQGVSVQRSYHGANWIGLRDSQRYVTTGSREVSLIPEWLALTLICVVMGLMWFRESRS